MPANVSRTVAVLGSLNLDFVLNIPRMPEAGETLASERSATFCGGKGANQAVACARMGASVAMIGRVGDDPAGLMLRTALKEEGIIVDGVVPTEGVATGAAAILLTPDGQNRIVIAAGANGRLDAADVVAQRARIDTASLLVCQLEVPLETVSAAVARAAAAKVPVLLNPAPALLLPAELLDGVDYLIPNESEASILTGVDVHDVPSATRAAAILRAQGVACVIVTLGAAGILIADDRGTRHLPAMPAEVVDTTAAGDSFIGGFAAGLVEGLDTDEAASLGLRAARICVGREGAQASLPRRSEI
ncbi:MAG TPA: ribokinase [Alphaproteobacteria bacterium]|nr:ribokinase [Alphaproteobacteria bacterium]